MVGLLFLIFFFFSILRCSKHCKIFSDYFPKCKQTLEKQSFSLKSFTFINILRWRMFYVETNGALGQFVGRDVVSSCLGTWHLAVAVFFYFSFFFLEVMTVRLGEHK